MKKRDYSRRKALGLVTGALASVFMPGCNRPEGFYGPPSMFDPHANEPEDVYGPPPDDDPTVYDPQTNIVETVYGPPTNLTPFTPGDNVAQPVYGPPEWFTGGTVTAASAGAWVSLGAESWGAQADADPDATVVPATGAAPAAGAEDSPDHLA